MKTTKTLHAIVAIACLSLALLMSSCKKTKTGPAEIITVEPNSIAYIYKAADASGLAYKTLLEENNCHVTLIEKAMVAKTNFAKFSLVVIDHNTDEPGLTSTWTDADANAMQVGGKPMLLLGVGGSQFANKIKNTINYLNSATFSDKGFWVKDKSSVIYKTPFLISIPTSTPQMILYPVAVQGLGQNVPAGTLDGVTLYGSFVSTSTYYPVTYEKTAM